MFTGLITDIGEIAGIERRGDTWMKIRCGYDPSGIAIGSSICCSGVCLTVIEAGGSAGAAWFAVEVSQETLDKTTLGSWTDGTKINLERSLKLGDEMGGHLVSGHVDGVCEIAEIVSDGDSKRFTFEAPGELARFVAPKGSVALDGTSFTVNEVSGPIFGVNIIPHTLDVTTWGEKTPGGPVNIEIDMLARYVARLADYR